MLIAKIENNVVQASKKLDRDKDYQCPSCLQSVILKAGCEKIPHFAHKVTNNCVEYEKETKEHLEMKFNISKLLEIPPRHLEYTGINGVKPDFVKVINGKMFCFEVQHSSISAKEIERRNKIYLDKNTVPIWIFDSKKFKTKITENEHKLKQSERYILKTYKNILYYFRTNDGFYISTCNFDNVYRNVEYQDLNYNKKCKTIKLLSNYQIILKFDSNVILNVNFYQYLLETNEKIGNIRYITCKKCNKLIKIDQKDLWKKLCFNCYKMEKVNNN